jgi:hypothetical protein
VKSPKTLPPEVARGFVKDMRAFFAEEDATRRDAIAVRQLHALKEHHGPREKPLRLSDVKQMFHEMKGSPRLVRLVPKILVVAALPTSSSAAWSDYPVARFRFSPVVSS